MTTASQYGGKKNYGDPKEELPVPTVQKGISPSNWQNICPEHNKNTCDLDCRNCQYYKG